jgi:peptidoglycan/xylan/chitin deacetylase (PgdA/CDA1 family)
MAYLAMHSYRVLSMAEVVECCANRNPVEKRTVVLTFDDGYANNHSEVLPVLKKYGFRATFYIATGFVGGQASWMVRDLQGMFPGLQKGIDATGLVSRCDRAKVRQRIPYLLRLSPARAAFELQALCEAAEFSMMTWDQVRDLHMAGMEIGDHTHSHPFLTELTDMELATELDRSRSMLELVIGRPVRSLCYPYGVYNSQVAQVVRHTGYTSACTTESGLTNFFSSDRYAMRRLLISDRDSLGRFGLLLSVVGRGILELKPWVKRILGRAGSSTQSEVTRATGSA